VNLYVAVLWKIWARFKQFKTKGAFSELCHIFIALNIQVIYNCILAVTY